jgi:hypothetical protein
MPPASRIYTSRNWLEYWAGLQQNLMRGRKEGDAGSASLALRPFVP